MFPSLNSATPPRSTSPSLVPHEELQYGEQYVAAKRPAGLPLAQFPDRFRPSNSYSVLTTIDINGRIADRSPLQALAWPPGLSISISLMVPLIVIAPDTTSREHVTSQGHIRLSASIRHVLQLTSGDRLYMTAVIDTDRLTICPPSVIDEFVNRLQQEVTQA